MRTFFIALGCLLCLGVLMTVGAALADPAGTPRSRSRLPVPASLANTSGTNTGDVTLAAIGSSANANGASLSGQALTLQPASGSFGGVVTTGTQTFAGAKSFSSTLTCTAGSGTAQLAINNGSVAWNFVETSNNLSLNAVNDPYLQWDFNSGVNGFPYGIKVPSAGTTFSALSGTGVTIGSHGTAITDAPYCTATLDFASALVGACSADLTISCTGCTTTSALAPNIPNAAMVAGSQFNFWVSASGTVSVRHCCEAGTSCDPASSVFGVQCFAH